ncbi:MAG TPA: endolytic transglycosylase MltG, partial [Caulobacteraceae bacterium]|nr:endolytic transglycosylase MltG [Caulobacteraceae bacterium]
FAALLAFEIWAPGPSAAPTSVILAPGGGVRGVARDLGRARAIRSPAVFVVAAELSGAGHSLKAGEYAFAPHASLAAVLDSIRHGLIVRHYVTIPEGLSSAQVADILAADPALSGPTPIPPEGSVLPETYQVRRGETRAALVARMEHDQGVLLARLWAARAPGLPYRDPEQAVILASVVEKETAVPVERPKVAAVFLNRLRQGMRLGSDPTVIYGLTRGRPLGHGLTVSELASDTPWNTYRVAGLPPTPIGNPGRASLEAALAPAKTDDLYFVADGSGGHAFSATLEEHQRNVAHWREIEKRSGAARGTG